MYEMDTIQRSFLSMMILFVFVPQPMLSTPHIWDVLVNAWELIITALQEKPAEIPSGTMYSSSRSVPLRISPTSNATHPCGAVTR
jgi:hypothetical protein